MQSPGLVRLKEQLFSCSMPSSARPKTLTLDQHDYGATRPFTF